MDLWEEHESWVLIPALPLASWGISGVTSLPCAWIPLLVKWRSCTCPSKHLHTAGAEIPIHLAFQALWPLSSFFPISSLLLSHNSRWAPHQEGSPKLWQKPFPAHLSGWAHSLPCLVLPVSFLTLSCSGTEAGTPAHILSLCSDPTSCAARLCRLQFITEKCVRGP